MQFSNAWIEKIQNFRKKKRKLKLKLKTLDFSK